MRFQFGYRLFEFLGDLVSSFLSFTFKGSSLVFGEKYVDHYFAFAAAPVIIYFGSIISMFYHLRFVQYIVCKVSWVVSSCNFN